MAGAPEAAPFPRTDRLRRSWEFRRANRRGRRIDGGHFVILVAPSAQKGRMGARLGVTVSRRVGNAVRRNYVKRRIREWFRQNSRQLRGLDVVVIARPQAASLSGVEIDGVLSRALRAAGELAA